MLNLSHSTVDIAITCSDFAASLDFYHNKLGLEIVLDLEIPDNLARDVGTRADRLSASPSQGRQYAHQIDGYRITATETSG